MNQGAMDVRLYQNMQRVANPSAKTMATVRKFMERMDALAAKTTGINPEMISFFFAKTANVQKACELQRQCDAWASQIGPAATIKLNKMRNNMKLNKIKDKLHQQMSDDLGHYYTQMSVGFDGLLNRMKDQCEFFNSFTESVKDFHEQQAAWRIKFEEQAINKLKSLRDYQCELRDRVMTLIATLSDQARQRQGFEMDIEDQQHLNLEYDKLSRGMTRSGSSMEAEIVHLDGRIKDLAIKIPARIKEGKVQTFKISEHIVDRVCQLKSDIAKHDEELDAIQTRLTMLQVYQREAQDRKIV